MWQLWLLPVHDVLLSLYWSQISDAAFLLLQCCSSQVARQQLTDMIFKTTWNKEKHFNTKTELNLWSELSLEILQPLLTSETCQAEMQIGVCTNSNLIIFNVSSKQMQHDYTFLHHLTTPAACQALIGRTPVKNAASSLASMKSEDKNPSHCGDFKQSGERKRPWVRNCFSVSCSVTQCDSVCACVCVCVCVGVCVHTRLPHISTDFSLIRMGGLDSGSDGAERERNVKRWIFSHILNLKL